MILVVQVWLIKVTGDSVSIIDFRSINLLERLHRTDGTDKLKTSVIAQQITREIKSQRRNAILRHEIANLQAHFVEILLRQRRAVGLVFNA